MAEPILARPCSFIKRTFISSAISQVVDAKHTKPSETSGKMGVIQFSQSKGTSKLASVTYKSQPSTHATRGKIPLVGNDRIFKVESIIWPEEVETFISSLLIGRTLHVCCGKSKLGDVRLDLYEESADIRCDAADMREFVDDQSFDTVLYDGPYNSRLEQLHKTLQELPRIARKRIIIQAWYLAATKEGYYRKAQEQFALTSIYAHAPHSYFGRMTSIQVYDSLDNLSGSGELHQSTHFDTNPIAPEIVREPISSYPDTAAPATWKPPQPSVSKLVTAPNFPKASVATPEVDKAAQRLLGNFATPPCYAKLAHDYLVEAAGSEDDLYRRGWWDMAAGAGELTEPCPPTMTGTLFLSSLLHDGMGAMGVKTSTDAVVFAHDFLNEADECLPNALSTALQSQREWVFLVNPPFTASTTVRGHLLPDVSKSAVARIMVKDGFKRAAHISTLQFMYRLLLLTEQYGIQAMIGIFSQASLLTHDSYASFRKRFEQSFRYQYGFCTNGAEFGAHGEWPLVFTVWSSHQSQLATSNVPSTYDTDIYVQGKRKGQKTFCTVEEPLSRWIVRPVNTVPALPVTNAKNVDRSSRVLLSHLPEEALGYAAFSSNDVMHSKRCFLLSSAFSRGAGWGITADNFEESLVALGARCLVKGNWLNDRDQFSQPDVWDSGYRQWSYDLILWLLTSNFNHSASLKADYQGKSYSVTNQFFWMSPDKIAAVPNMPDVIVREAKIAPMPFAANWLARETFSPDASALLDYMTEMVVVTAHLREKADPVYRLLRWDAGWYQIRQGMLWQKGAPRQASGLIERYREFKKDHVALGERLLAGIYDFGVLPR